MTSERENPAFVGFNHCGHCLPDCGFLFNDSYHLGRCSYTHFGGDICVSGSYKVYSVNGAITIESQRVNPAQAHQ